MEKESIPQRKARKRIAMNESRHDTTIDYDFPHTGNIEIMDTLQI